MSEEGNAAVSDNETPDAPVSLADDKGNLKEGWLDELDEDLRGEKYLQEVKTVQALAKGTVHARRLVGKDKMVIPNEESGEEVWNEYYKVGGKPETPQDYNLIKPDDFPDEYYSQERADGWMQFFHDIHLSKKQAQAIFERHNLEELSSYQAGDREILENQKRVKNELLAEKGNAYEQFVHLGNIAVEQGVGGDVEFKKRLTEKFGDDADFIRFSGNLGSKFAEHGVVTNTNIPTPADIESRIKQEMAKESYANGNHPDHKNQVRRVQALFEERDKSLQTGFVK